MVVAYRSIDPAPPDTLVISTGRPDGAYYRYAMRYAELLAEDGITLKILESNGAVENLVRLKDPASDVDLAFVQGGVASPSDAETLASLGSVFYEPIWFFYDAEYGEAIDTLAAIGQQRFAIGDVGSGTHAVIRRLFDEAGFSTALENALPIGGNDATRALLSKAIDGAFFIIAPDAPALVPLLHSGQIRQMNFERAEAYAIRHRYLDWVSVPRGGLDLARDIPPRDIKLLATTANLVAKKDTHPALIDLVLSKAAMVHGRGGMFESNGEFPSADHVDLPLHERADRYLSRGPDLLNRYLPFWAANLIDRFKVMLIPFVVLFIPLFNILLPLVVLNIRFRIFRWYGALLRIERQLPDASAEQREKAVDHLEHIEQRLIKMKVPVMFNQDLYILREHVASLRARLADDQQELQS